MRYIYTLFLMLFSLCASAQFSLNAGYSLSLPQQKMADNINPLHSITGGIMYNLPGVLSRIQAGIVVGWGSYANSRKMQTFNFGNGTSTETWVNYSSNVVQGSFTGRVFF